MTVKVGDLLGNRFKVRQDVTAHIGSPNSGQTQIWNAGKLSPPIYSYVVLDGVVWYEFGSVPPIRWIRHDPDALKPVADFGGGQFLDDSNERDPATTAGLLASLGNLAGTAADEITTFFKLFLVAVFLIVAVKIWQFFD